MDDYDNEFLFYKLLIKKYSKIIFFLFKTIFDSHCKLI